MQKNLKCFKAYDIRGTAPDELNPEFCHALGAAIAAVYQPVSVVLGRDARLSSPGLEQELTTSLIEQGVNVFSLGFCGTEEIYHAAAFGDFDLGIMVTGSHNPANENGFKFVTRGAVPVGRDSGLLEIGQFTTQFLASPAQPAAAPGKRDTLSLRKAFIDWLLQYSGFADSQSRQPRMRIVIDTGNGCAGPVLTELAAYLPIEIIPLNFEPDGSFPNGIPNPLLPEKRHAASRAVLQNKADLGVAFDGDFDRCFFYDHKGQFIESCYIAGLLASELLLSHPDEKIVHDCRVYWNTRDLILALGGQPVAGRGGHTYMKESMRQENAIFGAEMSGHFFYRDFAYCDSGMLTLLLMLATLMRSQQTLAELVEAGMAAYPCSGEVNFRVSDARRLIEEVWEKYRRDAIDADRLDGISLEFPGWRFNLRSSNTEPILRLNIEARGDAELVKKKLAELTSFITG